jgi:hypothetical protein
MLIFEDRDVAEAPIAFQVENALAEDLQRLGNLLLGDLSQGHSVLRCFHYDFVCADCVHEVEHALGPAVGVSFHPEERGAIVKDSGCPSPLRVTPFANGGRRQVLVTRAEGAQSALVVSVGHYRALAGHHPASREGV